MNLGPFSWDKRDTQERKRSPLGGRFFGFARLVAPRIQTIISGVGANYSQSSINHLMNVPDAFNLWQRDPSVGALLG